MEIQERECKEEKEIKWDATSEPETSPRTRAHSHSSNSHNSITPLNDFHDADAAIAHTHAHPNEDSSEMKDEWDDLESKSTHDNEHATNAHTNTEIAIKVQPSVKSECDCDSSADPPHAPAAPAPAPLSFYHQWRTSPLLLATLTIWAGINIVQRLFNLFWLPIALLATPPTRSPYKDDLTSDNLALSLGHQVLVGLFIVYVFWATVRVVIPNLVQCARMALLSRHVPLLCRVYPSRLIWLAMRAVRAEEKRDRQRLITLATLAPHVCTHDTVTASTIAITATPTATCASSSSTSTSTAMTANEVAIVAIQPPHAQNDTQAATALTTTEANVSLNASSVCIQILPTDTADAAVPCSAHHSTPPLPHELIQLILEYI